jgi:MoaA/NifB/PqqE/SkfB family radical SAM enzyme
MMKQRISLPSTANYIAAFLTLSCNLRCNYCINRPDQACQPRDLLSARDWLGWLNQLDLPDDLPITLQGGEPSLHPGFLEIIQGLRPGLHVDILTNLSFDVENFVRTIPPERFQRKAPYAAIRVTYHPGQSDLESLMKKFVYLKDRHYPIGLYSIRIPGTERLIEKLGTRARELGIDYRTKEYLGHWRGEVLGTYHYDNAVMAKELKDVQCRTTEVLIAPNGNVHRCHRDLYQNEFAIGHILDDYRPVFAFRSCGKFGECNPCDVKRKTDRFQRDGHASVEIKFPQPTANAELVP